MNSLSEQIATLVLSKGYQVATTVAGPLVAAGLLASGRGRVRFRERLGGWEPFPGPVAWWFHAASVGEVQGILPLLRKVRDRYPEEPSLLTCTSPTGLDRAGNIVRDLRILPIDAPWCVRRALARVEKPQIVFAETELWPELLRQSLARGLRCHIINGRISDYTVEWYRWLSPLISPLLRQVSSVSVVDEVQYDRFLRMGVPQERLSVTGHTKYDVDLTRPSSEEREALRRDFFGSMKADEKVVTLGSVRPGEEAVWFDAFQQASSEGAPLRLIVAPRHAEKFDFFARELERRGIRYRCYSHGVEGEGEDYPVLLLDAMGVLQRAYAASDLAFIGATLVDIGGHNPLEAAVFGVPVCVGPYTSVIQTVVSELDGAKGIIKVGAYNDILDTLRRLFTDPGSLEAIGLNAERVVLRHQGASERVLSVLRHE